MNSISPRPSVAATLAGYRPVAIAQPTVHHSQRGGVLYMHTAQPLQAYPGRILERLVHWAQVAPQRTFFADRQGDAWREVSYAQMLAQVRCLASHLCSLGLTAERPLMILSGNSLAHLQVALAAMYAGVPYCPVSPSYALLSQDYAKLRHVCQVLQPGLVFVETVAPFAPALDAALAPTVPLLAGAGTVPGRRVWPLAPWLQAGDTAVADRAFAATGADTLAKFLFTSGSTQAPKAVMTTAGMLCANQQMLLQTFPVFGEQPPVLVDWLPWNHTFGGSHNLGIVLYNGGTFYLDGGKPTPQGMAETLRNLRDVSPTAYLTVPRGWEELVGALEQDGALRERFFARMSLFFFAAAGLSQRIWDRLDRVAVAHCGERIRMMAGLGMTEASPSCTFTTGPLAVAGYVGVPAPGCELKLVPVDGKLEARFRGPHIMPGYWRAPEQSAAAFDEEGFYRSGDALTLADPAAPEQGLMFDGRIAEDFKLSSGVFVSVGPLRNRAVLSGAPLVQDVVVAGPDREALGLLVFPRLADCRALAALGAGASDAQVLASPRVTAWFSQWLVGLNSSATGNASRVQWLALLPQPPSLDLGEITDKGSLNQRAVLTHRAAAVDAAYEGLWPLMVHA